MTATGSAGTGAGERLPDEVVETLLADEDLRLILSCLAGRDGPMAVEDLARAVASRESDVEPSAVADDTVGVYREELFQEHLPRLTPTGVVAYDSLLGTVALDTTDERVLSELH